MDHQPVKQLVLVKHISVHPCEKYLITDISIGITMSSNLVYFVFIYLGEILIGVGGGKLLLKTTPGDPCNVVFAPDGGIGVTDPG